MKIGIYRGDDMFNLVIKDLKLSQKINMFIMPIALFISAMEVNASIEADNSLPMNMIYLSMMIMLIFMSSIYVSGYDDKNKSYIVFNSFPLDRREIVREKYLFLLVCIIINCFSIIVFTNIVRGILGGGIVSTGWDFIAAMNISIIFFSIYYPFYFKIEEGMMVINQIIWVLVAVGPSLLGKIANRLEGTRVLDWILSLNMRQINLYISIFAFAMYFVSLQISKRLYLEREF